MGGDRGMCCAGAAGFGAQDSPRPIPRAGRTRQTGHHGPGWATGTSGECGPGPRPPEGGSPAFRSPRLTPEPPQGPPGLPGLKGDTGAKGEKVSGVTWVLGVTAAP